MSSGEERRGAGRRERRVSDGAGLALRILMLPLLLLVALPLAIVIGALYLSFALLLHLAVLVWWLPRGRRVLFVYSNSPTWQARLETEVLPRLPPDAVVLNWSRRNEWPRFSLSVWLFHTFGGTRNYVPIGMVFRPFAPPRTFRFWRAYRDYKHGKQREVEELEAAFFAAIQRD